MTRGNMLLGGCAEDLEKKFRKRLIERTLNPNLGLMEIANEYKWKW